MSGSGSGWGTLLVMVVVLGLVTAAMRLMARLVARTAARRTQQHHERTEALRLRVNAERAERGLEPFPTLAEMRAVAMDSARAAHPEGLRTGSGDDAPVPEGAIRYGVFVVPEAIPHPAAPSVPLEAFFSDARGSYVSSLAEEAVAQGQRLDVDSAIVVFYGSLLRLFALRPAAEVLAEVVDVIEHEVHHLRDAEAYVPYAQSLSRQDDLSAFWWHMKRRRPLRRAGA